MPGAGCEDRLHRRRPRRPVLRAADEEADAGARHHRGRAQQALRHLRLGRGVLRRDDGQHARVGPRHRRHDRAGVQPLGRHRAALQGPPHPLAAATASSASGARSCSTSCRRAARNSASKLVFETEVESDADYPDADLVIASDGINSKIRSKYAEVFKPDIVTRAATASSGSAPPSSTTPSPSSSRRPSTAGSRRTSTSSTTRPPPSSSRRPSSVEGARPGQRGAGRVGRLLREALRRQPAAATS